MTVRSELGRGSMFGIELPLAVAGQVTGKSAVPAAGSHQGYHILCVDNEIQIVEGMNSLLAEWGFSVSVASQPEQAWELACELKPDLIVMDYHLDQTLTGLSVLEDWHSRGLADVPVIMITADYTEEVRQAIEKRGYRLLKKPVRPLQLRALLASLLR